MDRGLFRPLFGAQIIIVGTGVWCVLDVISRHANYYLGPRSCIQGIGFVLILHHFPSQASS